MTTLTELRALAEAATKPPEKYRPFNTDLMALHTALSPSVVLAMIDLCNLAVDARSYLISLQERLHDCPLRDGTTSMWKQIDAALARLEQEQGR